LYPARSPPSRSPGADFGFGGALSGGSSVGGSLGAGRGGLARVWANLIGYVAPRRWGRPGAPVAAPPPGAAPGPAAPTPHCTAPDPATGRCDAAWTDAALAALLRRVGLPALADAAEREIRSSGPRGVSRTLGANRDWSGTLSLGEQQRVAAARLVLRRPPLALIDEGTSALDPATEALVYREIASSCDGWISVGHRPTLARHHARVLEAKGGGRWDLMDASIWLARQEGGGEGAVR